MKLITHILSVSFCKFVFLLLFITVAFSASVLAQSSADLRRSYSLTEDGHLHARENVDVIASCYPYQHRCDTRIEPHLSSNKVSTEIPQILADSVIDEIAPAIKRGRLLSSFNFVSGRNSLLTNIYEYAEISRAITAWGMPEATVKFATIKWVEHRKGVLLVLSESSNKSLQRCAFSYSPVQDLRRRREACAR